MEIIEDKSCFYAGKEGESYTWENIVLQNFVCIKDGYHYVDFLEVQCKLPFMSFRLFEPRQLLDKCGNWHNILGMHVKIDPKQINNAATQKLTLTFEYVELFSGETK